MIRVLALAVILVLALLAVLAAARFDRGYLIIVFPPWRIEMSFILAIAVTFGLYVLTYLAFKLLRATLRLPAELRARRERRLWERSADEASRAVAALLGDQPAHALSLAEAARRRRPNALAALVAAHAARRQGDLAAAARHAGAVTGSEAGELIAARQALVAELDARAAEPSAPALPERAG